MMRIRVFEGIHMIGTPILGKCSPTRMDFRFGVQGLGFLAYAFFIRGLRFKV